MSDDRQRAQLAFLNQANQFHRERFAAEAELAARIQSYELAYRMQSSAPEAIQLDTEPEHINRLYGIGDPRCDHVARQCLIARRLVERGVRFIQIYSGGMDNQLSWDGHADIKGNHEQFAGETDRPVAGLLADLDQRGLLDETLVIWGGEFGRLPVAQTGKKPGRDHNPHGFTVWLAGGGVKGGVSHGATDEVGYAAAVDPVHINDLHATILHLLGINHEQLTYLYNGRRFRLTDVAGKVVRSVLALIYRNFVFLRISRKSHRGSYKPIEPVIRTCLCDRGKSVSLAVIEEADGFGSAIQLPDRHRLCYVGPAPVTVRRLPTDQEKGAGRAHGEHLRVVEREARAPDRLAEIPRCVPVRETHTDSTLA